MLLPLPRAVVARSMWLESCREGIHNHRRCGDLDPFFKSFGIRLPDCVCHVQGENDDLARLRRLEVSRCCRHPMTLRFSSHACFNGGPKRAAVDADARPESQHTSWAGGCARLQCGELEGLQHQRGKESRLKWPCHGPNQGSAGEHSGRPPRHREEATSLLFRMPCGGRGNKASTQAGRGLHSPSCG